MTRFGNANEHGDWETAHHVFTYANAVHQMLRRIGSADSDTYANAVRGILHGACHRVSLRCSASACAAAASAHCAAVNSTSPILTSCPGSAGADVVSPGFAVGSLGGAPACDSAYWIFSL
jgi:hypothetical protein